MSGYESRYFQYPDFKVVRVRGREQLRDYEEDPAATEVQVVPVDAIVIRRDELPEVSDFGPDGPTAYLAMVAGEEVYAGNTADDTRLWGLRYLALSEHLREHPPVDEEQVKALNALMVEAANKDLVSIEGGIEFERFLVERGVRVEAKS